MVEESSHSREPVAGKEIDKGEFDIFSEGKIEMYRHGCETIGINVDDVVDQVIQAGKKPTIIDPSRGALPIWINAIDFIKKADPDNRLVDPKKTRYYPTGTFSYLSDGRIGEENGHEEESEVDVVLFPFTADVTTSVGDSEELAKRLRQSASRAIVDLAYGDRNSLDLQWNFFLLRKMKEQEHGDFNWNPEELIKSLESLKPSDDRHLILVDTVLSGRAVANITEAFKKLGHPVTPVLSVDNQNGGKVINRYIGNIQRDMSSEFVAPDTFTEFPLVTEDEGPVLLGLNAINFSNFNNEHLFYDTINNFDRDFLPQSCLWAIPPEGYQTDLFRSFISRCSGDIDMSDADDINRWEQDSRQIKYLLKSRSQGGEKVKNMIKTQRKIDINESSSHIVSVKLDDRDASEWIRQFASSRPI